MELEEMQKVWTEMSEQREKQAHLTDKLIIMMTRQQYKNRLSKIAIPETISSVVSFAGVLLILINFRKYDTGYIVACGIISAVILLVLPVLSLQSIHRMNNLHIGGNNYKQTLIEFAKGKRQFLFVQKLSFYLTFVLMIVLLPVILKIMNVKNIHIKPMVWFVYLPVTFLFFAFLARRVYGCYAGTTVRMENLLKEMEK